MAADMAVTVGHEIKRNADDGQFITVPFLQGDQLRHFAKAGGTPGRPEVDQHNFAAKLRKLHPLAVEGIKAEICRRHRLASGDRLTRNFQLDWREVSLMRSPPRL